MNIFATLTKISRNENVKRILQACNVGVSVVSWQAQPQDAQLARLQRRDAEQDAEIEVCVEGYICNVSNNCQMNYMSKNSNITKKKRLLLFCDSLTSGGAQRQIVGLAKLLHEKDYEVKLIYYHQLEFYKTFLDENNIPNELVQRDQNSKKRIFRIRNAIKSFNPDVVISYLDTPNIIACILKVCGMKYKLIVSERNTTQKLTLKEKLKFYFMRWADCVVPNSYSQERYIVHHFSKLSLKVYTITNFVDTEMFCPKKQVHSDICRIIVVGRVTEQKNTLRFLNALKILKDEGVRFNANWYGYSSPNYIEECKKYIHDNDLKEEFTFHDPSMDIVKRYQEHDVFILPSIYEGFPNVICEAMCCGKPILCSRICDNPLIVEEGGNGYMFDPNNVNEIASVVKKFISLPDEQRQLMGKRSRDLSIEKFSSDNFIKQYINLIESLT